MLDPEFTPWNGHSSQCFKSINRAGIPNRRARATGFRNEFCIILLQEFSACLIMTVNELIANGLLEIITKAFRTVPDVPSSQYRQVFFNFITPVSP